MKLSCGVGYISRCEQIAQNATIDFEGPTPAGDAYDARPSLGGCSAALTLASSAIRNTGDDTYG